MSDALKKLLKAKADKDAKSSDNLPETLNAIQSAASALSISQLAAIVGKLQKLVELLLLKDVSEIKTAFSDFQHPEHDHAESDKAALDGLEKLVTVRKGENGGREFLLYRATDNFEYEKCATPFGPANKHPQKSNNDRTTGNADMRPIDYKTVSVTDWVISAPVAESIRVGANPIVAVWASDASVQSVNGSQKNKGTWGELGKNPQSEMVTISLKAGCYKLYSELKA